MCGKGLNYVPLMSTNITFMPGMFLTRFWNRWISVLIKNCCSWSRVLSAHGQLWQTSLPKNTQAHLGQKCCSAFQFTSSSLSLWILGVKWSLSTSHANGGCQSWKTEGFHQKIRKRKEVSVTVKSQGSWSMKRPLWAPESPQPHQNTELGVEGLGHSLACEGARAELTPQSPHWERVQRAGMVRSVQWVPLSPPQNTSLGLKNR